MMRCTVTVILLKVLLFNSLADASLTERITENYLWDGVTAFIVVDREVIEDKLEEWHNSISGGCDGRDGEDLHKDTKIGSEFAVVWCDRVLSPRLYLPTYPIFPGIIEENQHVLYLGTGYVNFYDFQDLQDESVSIDGMEFDVTIPFLTDTPGGLPRYSLALLNFYERSRGDIPKPNIAFPYIPVDEITREENSVIVKNGSEEFQLFFERHTDPCELVNPKVRHEFDDYVDRDLQFGATMPDFSFCDRHPSENRYCTVGQSIKCSLQRASPNVCQTSWKTPSRVSCDTPARIGKVTPGFRDMMLLGTGEINVIATESFFGNFTLGLKYPCIE